jgi:hypothetical protein
MPKLTVALLAVALAGTASAAGWKSLRVDGSSEAAFAQSLAEFKEELSPARRYAFSEALKDIWVQGVKAAESEQREYTAGDYYRQLDGLRYEEVVTSTDPTGDIAKRRVRDGMRMVATVGRRGSWLPPRVAAAGIPWPESPAPIGPHGEQVRGTPDSGPVYRHQQRQMGQ